MQLNHINDKVLILESNALINAHISSILLKKGYQRSLSQLSLRSNLNIIENFKPDIIIINRIIFHKNYSYLLNTYKNGSKVKFIFLFSIGTHYELKSKLKKHLYICVDKPFIASEILDSLTQ